MKNDSEIVVTNCGGASRTAFHETLCDIPVRVRRTSPFRLQISRVVSRDFWRKQSAKVPSPARSTCVGNFSNITSHFREVFPPSKLSSFFYYIHFEITGGPCDLTGSNWCDLFTNCTIFCFKSHLFSSQWGGYTKNKTTNQTSRLVLSNQSNCRKMKDMKDHVANFATFVSKTLIFSSQKMDDFNSKLAQYCSNKYLNWPSPVFGRFQNGCNKVVIEPRVVQFWSEIILVISNWTRAARSFNFEITRMISAQIALHSFQLPL